MPLDPVGLELPHREPFIFIDSVLEVIPTESAHAFKVFPPEEPFFRGHFPGNPIVPGVILAEALAQTAGIAAGKRDGGSFRLTAIKTMKFLGAVQPGERVELFARKAGAAGGLWQFEVTARAGERRVAEGVIVLSQS